MLVFNITSRYASIPLKIVRQIWENDRNGTSLCAKMVENVKSVKVWLMLVVGITAFHH